MKLDTQLISGLGLSIVLAVISTIVSWYLPLNAVMVSLLVGIAVGNILKLPDMLNPGIKFSSGTVLELSIVLMAFGINYGKLTDLGLESLLIVVAVVFGGLLISKFLVQQFRCPTDTGYLISFGTAICGSSAIASLSPLIGNNKSDTGIALAVVNLLGTIGMFLLPWIGPSFFNEEQLGLLIGATLHSVGNVVGAGFSISEYTGEIATTIKLGRVALLTPALLFYTWIVGQAKSSGEKFKFKLPWFLVAFIVVSVFVSLVGLPENISSGIKTITEVMLSIAMVAIGLKVSFVTLFQSGQRGIIYGIILFVIQLGIAGLLVGVM